MKVKENSIISSKSTAIVTIEGWLMSSTYIVHNVNDFVLLKVIVSLFICYSSDR
jgi:3-deoxy-D-arabino-heptulosonate 7-phosphate (DAHP) synthase